MQLSRSAWCSLAIFTIRCVTLESTGMLLWPDLDEFHYCLGECRRACRSLENNLGVSKFESQSWQPALKIPRSYLSKSGLLFVGTGGFSLVRIQTGP